MTDELKPCPFCGDADIDPAFWMCEDQTCGPGCNGCGATAHTSEAWNFRAPLPDVVAQGNATALQAFQFLLDNELHAEDEHDDDCPTCQAIRTIRAALSAPHAQRSDINDLIKMLGVHVDGVRHYLHLQIGKPLSKNLISAPEIALDNLHREMKAALASVPAEGPTAEAISSKLAEFFCGKQHMRDQAAKEIVAMFGSRSPAASAEIRDRIFWIMSRIRASSDAAAIADYLSQYLASTSQPDTATKPEPRG